MPEKIIRINIQSQIIITHGASQIILMETRQGTVDIVTGILCTQMDRLVQISFSLFILPLLEAYNGSCPPSIRVITVHIDGFVKITQSLYRIVLFQGDFPAHQIGTCISGGNCQKRTQIFLSRLIIFFLNMAKGKIMPKHHILRVVFDSGFIIFNRLVKLVLTDTCQSSDLVSTYHKRISLNRSITITLRSLIVIQIDFCQSTEEIRLI